MIGFWSRLGSDESKRLEEQIEQIEKKRTKTLSSIDTNRSEIEQMVQRPRSTADILDETLLQQVRLHLSEMEERAKKSTQLDELDDISENADVQGTFSAYFCPQEDILIEGQLAFGLMDWWGIPRSEIDNLRTLLLDELKKAESNPKAARGALCKLLSERNEWDAYRDFYEETMRLYAIWLFIAIIALLLIAIIFLHYSYLFVPLLIFGLLFAGGAGSCTSVVLKLPVLELSSKEKADSYLRRILSRISAGAIASLVGCGLLGWNLIPISVQGHTFTEYLNEGTRCLPAQCTSLSILILLAIAIIFGFSERALASFEERIFGNSTSKRRKV